MHTCDYSFVFLYCRASGVGGIPLIENEACAWTPHNVFLSMIVVESLSCKLEWGLAQVLAISIPLTIVVMESEVYECQTKYAKAIFVGFLKHHDSRSARNVCHYEPLPAPI